MKLLIVFIAMTTAGYAKADHYKNQKVVDCRIARMVDTSYFEEELSTTEYPDITIKKSPEGLYSVGIGAQLPYESSQGDVVSLKVENRIQSEFHILNSQGDELSLLIEWRVSLPKLVARLKEKGQSQFRTLGYGFCDLGIFN